MKGNFCGLPARGIECGRGAMASVTTRSARKRLSKATTRAARGRSIASRLFKVGSRKGENVPAKLHFLRNRKLAVPFG